MPNPMLALTIWNTQNRPGDRPIERLAVDSAVNCWYEGHIFAHMDEGKEVEIIPRGDGPPLPPFPAEDDPELWEIVRATTSKNFVSSDAAIAFAAGLGWEAGYRRGLACPGCKAFGDATAEEAARMRVGGTQVTIGDWRNSLFTEVKAKKKPK